jgi:hypothetical protein
MQMTEAKLADTLRRLESEVKKRSQETKDKAAASRKSRRTSIERSNIVQLPLWRDDRRGVPNDLVRSALFTVGNPRNKRRDMKQAIIAAIGDIEIRYTGEELRQDDEDVFLQLVHLARLADLGDIVTFSARSLLSALGWATDGGSYKRLKASITRLSANTLTVQNGERGYSGSLIRDFQWKGEGTRSSPKWQVRFEPRIVALFGQTTYTQVLWEQRLRLSNVGKWLHSFYATHAKPFPMKPDTLHRLSGSQVKEPRKFRQMLRTELDALVKVGFLETWDIDGKTGLVHVLRRPIETPEG